MIKVLITDDHPVVRQGIRQILAEYSDVEVTGEAGDGPELLHALRNGIFDVVLLDISLPGKSGIELLKEIKTIHADLPVLILSIYPVHQYAIRALRNGAAGYLPKSTLPDELIVAIRKAAAGKTYLTTSIAEILAADLSQPSLQPPHEKLSGREFEVLTLLAKGNSPKEIGKYLSLSVKTVSTYKERILLKLNLNSTAEIIRFAIREGLVD